MGAGSDPQRIQRASGHKVLRQLGEVHTGTSESINVHMLEGWVSLSRQDFGIGRSVVFQDFEFYFGPVTDLVELGLTFHPVPYIRF